MNLQFDAASLRARSARKRSLFRGKRELLWRIALLGLLLTSAVFMLVGERPLAWLSLGGAVLVLQPYLWWLLELKELPVKDSKDTSQLDAIADRDLLERIKEGQSPLDLWRAFDRSWQRAFIVNRLGLDGTAVEAMQSAHPSDSEKVWTTALSLKDHAQHQSLMVGHVIGAMIVCSEQSESWLAQQKLTIENVADMSLWQIRTDLVMRKLQHKRSFGGVARDWAAGYTPLLSRFAHDMSLDVQHGVYQHLYLQTHSQQLDGVVQSLSQNSSNSVALIGATGSGKTSLAYALAERLLDPANKRLSYYRVLALDASLIVAEAKRLGNLEELLLRLISEARRAGNIVLFFDDAHSFFNEESGAANMTNVLLQVMRTSSVRMLFALRPQDWQYLDSVASDVTARVNQLIVQEPDRQMTEKVLQDQSLAIEAETKTSITYQAIKEAYELADRYVPDQAFPGKAISLLRTAAGSATGGWVTHESVQLTIESMLGVKVADATLQETDTLLNLEEQLHQYMINQTHAVSVVSDSLRRARAGVKSKARPVGSFLFLGPTGVGKTELSKALARVYFGGEDKIIRVDMSEYSQASAVERLIVGSSNAGSFLGRVRQAPFSVVLLDEIEKAASEVHNLLLQMLDEGAMTDQDGRSVSFKDAIIITTSNAGADIIRNNIEQGKDLSEFSEAFTDQLIDSGQFKPELINRFDEVVLFRPLNKQELRQVVALLLGEVNRNLQSQQIQVSLTEAAVDYIVDEGYDPRLGARPMRRMMQRTVENVVAKRVLEGAMQPGVHTVLDVDDLR